jgi:exodeoxyribonuclease VIII
MIDFETLGNGKNACVTQIGACYFDPETGEIGEKFECNVDARSAVASGAEIDADTVYWWLSQQPAAIKSMTQEPLFDIETAFMALNEFLDGAKEIWSHATFDFVILQETMKRLKIKPAYHYGSARDIRTLMAITKAKKSGTREGIHHNGLADCIYQVGYVVNALKRLNRTGE